MTGRILSINETNSISPGRVVEISMEGVNAEKFEVVLIVDGQSFPLPVISWDDQRQVLAVRVPTFVPYTGQAGATLAVKYNESSIPVANRAPVIYDAILSATQGQSLTITLGPLTDADGDVLTYTVTGSNDIEPGDAANKIVLTPITTQQQILNVTTNDGKGGTATATVTVNVSEQPQSNTAPVISNQTFSIQQGQSLTIKLGPLTDADGDVLAYTVTGSNDIQSASQANQIIFNANGLGQQTLTATADDGKGGTATSTITVDVLAVPNVNTAPVLSNQALAMNEGQSLTITLGPLTDADGDVLTYTVTGSNDIQSASQANQRIFTPSMTGQTTLTVVADDGNGGTDTATVTVNVNTLPVISNKTVQAYQGQSLTINLGPLTDADGDVLAYTVTGSNDIAPGADANQIVLTSNVIGTQSLNVVADDGKGGTATSTITVDVLATTQPLANDVVVNMNQGETKTVVLGDASNSDGTIVYTITPPDFTVTGNTVEVTANTGGSHTYTITANDGVGDDVTFELKLNVITLQAEPSLIDFIGWSLLFNENNGDASLPNGANYAAVPQLLETLFQADSINHTRNDQIWGPEANMDSLSQQSILDFVAASTAQGIVVSGHSSGVGLDPNAPPSWRDDYDILANAINATGKTLVWYQGWMHTNNAEWGGTNVVSNFNDLKATHGGVMVKTYECLEYFRTNYPQYFNTTGVGYGTYPVDELFADTVHGTFALYYMVTLCLYRAFTGKLCDSILYEVPELYQLDSDLKSKIHDTVDLIQNDTWPGVDLQEYGTAYQEIWLAAGPDQGTLPPNGEAINFFDMATATTINLIDYKGNATGITATIPATVYGGGAQAAAAVGENAGFLPDALMDYVLFHDTSAIEITLSGLKPNSTYSFKGTGSRTGTGDRTQDWTIGGTLYQFDATENRDAGVIASFDSDGSGNAVLTLNESGNDWVYFCGAILTKGTKPIVYGEELISNEVEVV